MSDLKPESAQQHEGSKYLRTIYTAIPNEEGMDASITVDVRI